MKKTQINIINAPCFSDMMYDRKAIVYTPSKLTNEGRIDQITMNLNYGLGNANATIIFNSDETKETHTRQYHIYALSKLNTADLIVVMRKTDRSPEDLQKQYIQLSKTISEIESKRNRLYDKIYHREAARYEQQKDKFCSYLPGLDFLCEDLNSKKEFEFTVTEIDKKELKDLEEKIRNNQQKLLEIKELQQDLSNDTNDLTLLISWTLWKKIKLALFKLINGFLSKRTEQ